jgi:hypothetical protein
LAYLRYNAKKPEATISRNSQVIHHSRIHSSPPPGTQ